MARDQPSIETPAYLMTNFMKDELKDADIWKILNGEGPATSSEQLVNQPDEHEGTIIHWASRLQHVDLATLLLSKLPGQYLNEIITFQDMYGNTPLHLACFCNQIKLVKAVFGKLTNASDHLLKRNKFGFTIVHWACRYSDFEVVNEIITNASDSVFDELVKAKDNEYGCTVLHFACRYGQAESVRAILKRLEDTNGDGLENIIMKRHEFDKNLTKFPFTDKGHTEIAKSMPKKRLQGISSENPFEKKGGQTALMWGCMYGHLSVLKAFKELLEPDMLGKLLEVDDDWYGQTVLHYISDRGHAEIVKLILEGIGNIKFNALVQKTANTDSRGNCLTAMHWACGKGHTSVLDVVQKSVTPQVFKNLMNAKSTTNLTPLHLACKAGHYVIVQTIADKCNSQNKQTWNALLSVEDENGITALHWACEFGHDEVVRVIVNTSPSDVINRLMLKKDKQRQWTPLHLACAGGHQGVARVLADRFTSLEMVKLNCLQTDCPLHLAVQKKHFGIVTVLLSEKNFRFFENSAKNLPPSLVVDLCHRADFDAMFSVLNAANTIDRRGEILQKKFQAKDDDDRNVLHVACRRGNVDQIRKMLTYLTSLGRTVCQEIICNVDGNIIYRSDPIAELIHDAAKEYDCEGRMLKTSFWDGFKMGKNDVVSCVLNHASQSKDMIEHVLLNKCTDDTEQTVIHWACKTKYDSLQCIKRVLRVADKNDIDMQLLCQEDKFGRTFLSYVSDANEDVVKYLIKYITDWGSNNKFNEVCRWFLTNPDVHGDTAVHCIPQSKMTLLTNFLDRAQHDLEQVCLNNTSQSQITPNQSHKHVGHVVKTKSSTSNAKLELVERPQNTRINTSMKCIPSEFYMLHEGSESSSREMDNEPSLLDVMEKTKCLALIRHDYTQAYLKACLNAYVWPVFIPYLICYSLLLVSLSVFVSCHHARPFVNTSSSSSSTDVHIISTQPLAVTISQYALLAFATVICVAELLQMVARPRHYLKDPSNYIELPVCMCSLVISVVTLIVGYSTWLHHVAIVTMCLAWINAAVILSKISVHWWSEVNLLFTMLFRVFQSICRFLPVATIFILMMALVFSNLIHPQQPFAHAGFSIMSVLAMTVGELGYTDIFFSEDSTEIPPLYPITCVVFVIFVVIMTIAVMNLLVGTAVGEISALISQSEVIAFKTSVTLARECQAILDLICRVPANQPVRAQYSQIPQNTSSA